jgi:ParB family transcriptional regulator, chromosome partitioning protein
VQRRVAAGVLSAGHAKALLAVPDPAVQERLADRIVQEGMSVRATEELVRLRLLDDEAHRRRPARHAGRSSPRASSSSRRTSPTR